MSHFAILLAGRMVPTPALRQRLAGARVIAADAGIRHAVALGLVPELWVGDFDSAPHVPDAFSGIERTTFGRDKDQTDGELAIEAAVARGASRLTLVGALGGPRSDHAFAHFILALRYAGTGLAVALHDGIEDAYPLDTEPLRADLLPGTQFSVLKFSDVEGLTIEGAKWPLNDVALPFTSILTQSNEAAGPITVRLAKGAAILLAQADSSVR
ncbi:thiamine diphosphokinase [Jiella sp. MQZ9-1]|uniref:Thiamine diphosphokinase n=1 Tax=Jiella flava TaxID=2816857 RepID=A0A939FUR8_9HYPH|nr:thiamine diphosphokinase [Jiella flava]MBO0661815.1 thiamine diphosphokinase [Jiella flava]MCD2470456.1 thiamine diphosphokinase [Jiella flava]